MSIFPPKLVFSDFCLMYQKASNCSCSYHSSSIYAALETTLRDMQTKSSLGYVIEHLSQGNLNRFSGGKLSMSSSVVADILG